MSTELKELGLRKPLLERQNYTQKIGGYLFLKRKRNEKYSLLGHTA